MQTVPLFACLPMCQSITNSLKCLVLHCTTEMSTVLMLQNNMKGVALWCPQLRHLEIKVGCHKRFGKDCSLGKVATTFYQVTRVKLGYFLSLAELYFFIKHLGCTEIERLDIKPRTYHDIATCKVLASGVVRNPSIESLEGQCSYLLPAFKPWLAYILKKQGVKTAFR